MASNLVSNDETLTNESGFFNLNSFIANFISFKFLNGLVGCNVIILSKDKRCFNTSPVELESDEILSGLMRD